MDTYEKKYNEALERFKSFKEKYYIKDTNLGDVIFDKTGEMQKDFDDIFPELRESEDEQSYKRIEQLIRLNTSGAEKTRLLAYLEKQKDCILVPKSHLDPPGKDGEDGMKILEKQKELPFVKDVVLGFPGLYFYDGERMHFRGNPALEDTPHAFAMKQQEEKQKDLAADEYWRGFKNGRNEVIENPDKFNLQEKQKEPENVSASTMAPSCWAEEPSLQKEQKPAEKQDYSGLTDLERAIHRGFLAAGVENVPVTIIKETAQDCLAQTTAEWSEEDADILNCCISSIEEAKENRYAYKETDGDTSYDREIAFLKSLRPSWKPFKDEERLINTSISFLKDFADKGYENAVECIDWLKSKINGTSTNAK